MARKITFNGKTQSLAAWSRELSIPFSTIASRLDKLGMTVEQALTKPVDERFQPVKPQPIIIKAPPTLLKSVRGEAYCRWTEGPSRKTKYFGRHDDPEAHRAYAAWAAEWIAEQGRPASDATADTLSVAALVVRCIEWADRHFVKHGERTSEAHRFRAALFQVNELYGDKLAVEFGPVHLRAVRGVWVKEGKSIKTCNGYLDTVIRCWSYGVGQGWFPASAVEALRHVERLKPGRTEAVARTPVKSASAAHLDAILPHLHPDSERCRVLGDVLKLQRLTGMRPGEVLELRAEDIDQSSTPWLYRPASGGKTLHLEKEREVWFGPQARELLAPYLASAKPGQPVFRVQRRRGEGVAEIAIEYYRACLRKASKLAGVPIVKPNQVRHTRATELDAVGESAAAIAASLGNSEDVTQRVYIDSPGRREAKRVAEQYG